MFHVQTVHHAWYTDGIEGDENLWRLDFEIRGNEYQAQLFCKLAIPEDQLMNYTDKPIPYASARLFIERDNRLPGGDGERVDYACEAWGIAPERAQELLDMDSDAAVRSMAIAINFVEAMPNDRAFIRKHARRELSDIEAYWAHLDRITNPARTP